MATLALVSFYVAAAAIGVWQTVRVRERRLVPLIGLFALAAAGHERGTADALGLLCHYGAGVAGLVLLAMLLPRTASAAQPASPRKP
jgi:hypothetical protein